MGEKIPRHSILKREKIGKPFSKRDLSTIAYQHQITFPDANKTLIERRTQTRSSNHQGTQDLLLIGNQSRPKIFELNIRRPPPVYSTVTEVDEPRTLVGCTSDRKAEEHAVQFDNEGRLVRVSWKGIGWCCGSGVAGRFVRGLAGRL